MKEINANLLKIIIPFIANASFNLCWVNSPQLAAKHLPSIQLNTPSACGGVVYLKITTRNKHQMHTDG